MVYIVLLIIFFMFSFVFSVYQHELGHLKAHKKAGDRKTKIVVGIKLQGCIGDREEELRHSYEQELNILAAGYKRNFKIMILSFLLGILGFYMICYLYTIIGMVPDSFVPIVYLEFWFTMFVCNCMGWMENKYSLFEISKKKKARFDGDHYRVLKNAHKTYLENPSIQNKLELELALLQGDYKSKGMEVEFRGNIAYIHSEQKERKSGNIQYWKSLLVYDIENDKFSLFDDIPAGKTSGYDAVFERFINTYEQVS